MKKLDEDSFMKYFGIGFIAAGLISLCFTGVIIWGIIELVQWVKTK